MIVDRIRIEERAGGCALLGRILSEKNLLEPFDLEFFVHGARPDWLSEDGNPFVAAALMPAMALGESLRIEAPVGPLLMSRLQTIMDIYLAWRPSLSRAEVSAPVSLRKGGASGVCLFFSCGVDSFYSLLKDRERNPQGDEDSISHLLLVHGFDIKLNNTALFAMVREKAEKVAREVGKQLIVGETNIRALTDRLVPWDIYHGGAMAFTGLALGGLFHTCTIGSSYAYQELHPWGSHPLLDYLWSVIGLSFHHDGCESVRSAKVKFISHHQVALDNLRVCWKEGSRDYNCGECEKCLRTMIGLHLAGALDRTKTFSRPLCLKAVRRLRPSEQGGRYFMEDLLLGLGDSQTNRPLVSAIRHSLRMSHGRAQVGRLVRTLLGEQATLENLKLMLESGDVSEPSHPYPSSVGKKA